MTHSHSSKPGGGGRGGGGGSGNANANATTIHYKNINAISKYATEPQRKLKLNNNSTGSAGSSSSSRSSGTGFGLKKSKPNLISTFTIQRFAKSTDFGRSPVTVEADQIRFDYNVFVTTWQDQIRMRQFEKCEAYCKDVIHKLLHAQEVQAHNAEMYNVAVSDRYPYKEYQSKVHFSLAYLLKKYFKKFDEAKREYENSIDTDKENPGAHFNLANMLVDHYKDHKIAEYHFAKACALEPTYALYRMTFAEFLWHDCERYEESSAQYEELLKYTKDNEDIYFNYGLLLRDHLNNAFKARQQFQKALTLQPNDTEAQEELKYTTELLMQNEQNNVPITGTAFKVAVQTSVSSASYASNVIQEDVEAVTVQPPLSLTNTSSGNTKKSSGNDSLSLVSAGRAADYGQDSNDPNHNGSTRSSKHSKRASSARRSQAEMILLPELQNDESDNYAMLYHQINEEKQQMNVKLQKRKKELKQYRYQLNRITPKIREDIDAYVTQGVIAIQENSSNVLQILSIFKSILDKLPKPKTEDGSPRKKKNNK